MRTRRSRDDAHGMSRREKEIIDRSDAGMDEADIAAELGLAESYVRQIVRFYSGSWSANNSFDQMVRDGTTALGRALGATGRRYS